MTMFDMRTNLSRQVVDEVRQHLPEKVFATVIPRTVRLSEAPSFGKTIFDYDPLSPGATAYKNLAKEVIKRFDLTAVAPMTAVPAVAPPSPADHPTNEMENQQTTT